MHYFRNSVPVTTLGDCVSDVLVERSEEKARDRIALWSLSPGQGAAARAVATLKTLMPLRREDFAGRLAHALQEAAEYGNGFFLKGFSARRALGSSLVIEIDPLRLTKRLKHHAHGNKRRTYLQDRFVGSGNWRSLLQPLAASSTHRDVQETIHAGFDYRGTEAYRLALKRSHGPNPVRRNFVALKSPQLVENYFRHITELSLSIRENGVRRREDCRSVANAFRNLSVRLPWVEFMEADIGLAVGAEGEIYHFACGKHRTAAAQALRLAAVPAEVRVVHLAWLQNQIKATGLSPVDALLSGIRSLDISQRATAR